MVPESWQICSGVDAMRSWPHRETLYGCCTGLWRPRTTSEAGRPHRLSRLHVILSLLFGRGILVLLIFGDKVVHIGLCLREFHFVHALAGVPSKKALRLNIAVKYSATRLN